MAGRGFFGYDPYEYDCYYPASPYGYGYDPYYHRPAADAFFAEPLLTERLRPARRRAPTRHDDGFFPGFGVTGLAARTTACPRPSSRSPKSSPDCFKVEVTGPESDSPPAVPRVQAAARGLLARRMVREVHALERQTDAVVARVAAESEAL